MGSNNTLVYFPSNERIKRMELTLNKLIDAFDIGNLGISVFYETNGNICIYDKTYGYENEESGIYLSSTSKYDITDLSESFIAASIMQLFEKGLLSIESKLSKYFKLEDVSDSRFNMVKIRNLLDHSTGFPELEQVLSVETSPFDFSNALKNIYLNFSPGENTQYSRLNYILLQIIIQEVTGIDFRLYIQNNIFRPLGMSNTHFDKNRMSTNQKIINSLSNHESYSPAQLNYKLYSNMEDLSKWMTFILKRDDYNEIIHPSTLGLVFSTFTKAKGIKRGLGWLIDSYENNKIVYSNKALYSRLENIIFIPEKNIGILLLGSTNDDYASEILVRSIISTCLDIDYEIDSGIISSIIEKVLRDRGIDAALIKYKQLREGLFGIKNISESSLNMLGYRLLQLRKMDEAIKIFRLALVKYPESSNLHDSLSEAYSLYGDKTNAIKYAKEALSIDPKNVIALNRYINLNKSSHSKRAA